MQQESRKIWGKSFEAIKFKDLSQLDLDTFWNLLRLSRMYWMLQMSIATHSLCLSLFSLKTHTHTHTHTHISNYAHKHNSIFCNFTHNHAKQSKHQ